MDCHDIRIPTTKKLGYQLLRIFSKRVNVKLLPVNAEKWAAKIKKWGDANLLLPNLYVLPVFSSQLSVFSKLCIMNTLLYFLLLLCQSCRSVRKVFLGGLILGLIQSAHHGWLSMMMSSEGPVFSFASGSPNRKPTI